MLQELPSCDHFVPLARRDGELPGARSTRMYFDLAGELGTFVAVLITSIRPHNMQPIAP